MVSPAFLEHVLPELSADPLGTPLFVEVRPDVSSDTVRLLAQAGISVQAGIESLSDHQLRLMNKGTTALQNVRFLRDCRDHGLPVYWNLLSGVPGETDEDYDDLLEMLPHLESLPAPRTCGRVKLDRFSVYFREQARHGYLWSHACKAYEYVYPHPREILDELAYTFEFGRDEAEKSLGRRLRGLRLLDEVRDWQQAPTCSVRAVRKEGRLVVEDTRPQGPAHDLELSPLDEAVCRSAAQVVSREQLLGSVQSLWSGGGHRAARSLIDASLAKMLAHRLMIVRHGRYLALVGLDAQA